MKKIQSKKGRCYSALFNISIVFNLSTENNQKTEYPAADIASLSSEAEAFSFAVTETMRLPFEDE